mgnify:CR=1 FL=1
MSKRVRHLIRDFFGYIALACAGLILIAPLLWMLSTSLKEAGLEMTFPPKFIPDFAWGPNGTYDPDKALEVAARVMERRDIALSDTDRAVFRAVFDATKAFRRS